MLLLVIVLLILLTLYKTEELSQNNFTNADHSKLDGIATGATNTAAPHYTSAIAVGAGGLTQQNFTTTLKNKLDGIAASANNYVLPFTNNSSNWNTAYGWGDHASAGYTNDQTPAELLTAIKTVDGSGSGLDADLLDGVQLDNIVYGTYKGTFSGVTMNANSVDRTGLYSSSGFTNRPSGTSWTYLDTKRLYQSDNNYHKQFSYDAYNNNMWTRTNNGGTWSSWYAMWNSFNDGSGSGLDADLLDGQQGSYYRAYANLTGTPTIPSLSGYATESYVGTQISNLVDSSPAALNTLNELAAAIGDDASFSTTVTNNIATKAPLASPTFTGNPTAPSIRASSGAFYINRGSDGTQAIRVDADGVVVIPTNYFYVSASQGSYFSSAVRFRGTISNDTGTNVTFGQPISVSGTVAATGGNSTNWNTAYGWGNHASAGYLTSYTETDTLATVTGRGSSTSTALQITAAGRTLYNSNSHAYIQVGPNGGGAAGTFGAHRLTTSSGLDYTTYIGYDSYYSDTTQKWHALRSNLGRKWKVNFGGYHQNKFTIGTYDGGGTSGSSLTAGWLEADWTERFTVDASGGNGVKVLGNTVWHAGNDGSGSGLDADTVDGYNTSTSATANTVVVREGSGHIYGNYILGSYFNASSGNSENPTIGQIWTQSTGDNYLRKSTPTHFSSQMQNHFVRTDGSNPAFVKTPANYTSNLNSIVNAGVYFTEGTGSISNNPFGTSGSFLQFGDAGGQDVRLQFYAKSSLDRIAFRNQWGNGNWGTWKEFWTDANDGSGSGLDADLLDGQHGSYYAPASHVHSYLPLAGGTLTGTLTSRDIMIGSGYNLQRSTHQSGHFEGGHNNIGSTATKTSPIYTIGSSYNPAETTLSNMYGIGFSHINASFINVTGGSGWGMYVASDGDARIFLDAENGTVHTTGAYRVGSNIVWHAGNDGSGSGLDADLLDGLNSTAFIRSDTGTIPAARMPTVLPTAGNYVWSNSTTAGSYPGPGLQCAFVRGADGWPEYGSVLHVGGRGGSDAGGDFQIFGGHGAANGGNYLRFRNADNSASPTDAWTAWKTIWGSGNDGSGSGLDADLLDGQHGSYYAPASHNHSGVYLPIGGKAADSDLFDGHNSDRFVFGTSGQGTTNMGFASITNQKSGFYDVANSGTPTSTWYSLINMAHYGSNHGHQIAGSFYSHDLYHRNNNNTNLGSWSRIWSSLCDGSGSGLDADTVDGIDSASFLRSDTADTASGVISFTAGHGAINITNSSILSSATSSWTGNPGGAGKIQYHANRWYIVSDSSSNRIVQFRKDGADQSYIANDGTFVGNVTGTASGNLTAETDTLATVTGRGASTSTEIDFNNDIHVRNVVSDNNYGEGMFGVYASTRHQHVWSMGEAYKLNAAGTSVGNLYGLSYTHTNVGTGYGANSAAGLGHQLNGRANGTLQWALGDGIYSTVTGNVWGASNDGSGSGLDADLLDGQQGSYYFQSSVSDQEEAYHLDIRDSRAAMVTPDGEDDRRVSAHFTNQIPGYSDWRSAITLKGWSDGYYAWQIHGPSSTGNPNSGLYYRDGKGSTWNSSYEIWHAGRDGSGSGLDADLLDGIDSARVVYASGTNAMGVSRVGFASLTNSRAGFYDVYNSGTPTTTWYSLVNMPHSSANHGHQIAGSFYSAGDIYNRNNNNTSLSAWAKIWNTVNDGAGSGLVADYATKVTFNTQGNSNTTLKLLLGDPSNSTIAAGTVYKDNELSYNTSSNTLNTGSINFSNWSYTDYKNTGSGGQHYVHNGNGGSDQTIDGSQGSSNLRTLGVSSTGELGQDIVEQSFTYTRAQFHAMSLTPFEILNFDDGRGSNPGRIPVILEVLLMLSYSSPVQTCIGSGSGNWIELVQDHHLTNKIIAGFTCGSVQLMCGNSGARCALIYQDRKSRLYYAEKPLKFRRTSTNTTLHSNVTHIHLKVRYKFYDGASF